MKNTLYQEQASDLALALFQHMATDVSAPAFFVADPDDDFRLLQASATFRHFGNCHETHHGMPLEEYIPILSPDKLQRLWQKTRDYRSASFESEYQLISGQRITVEISFSLMSYGERELMAGYMRDISDRKQYEAQLQQQRQSFTESQRIAHVGSWRLNLASNVLDWSDEVFRIFEIEPTRFGSSYEAFLEIVHPDDRDALNRAYAISLKNRGPYEIEHRLLMADGRIKYVVERGETSYDEDGAPLCSLGTVQDITERKVAEIALRERESFLDSLLDTMPLPVFYKDREGRYQGFNKAYEDFFGAKQEDLLGKTAFDISPQELAEIYHAKDEALFADGGIQQYQSQVKNRHGQVRDVIFNKAVFTDMRGTSSGLIGAILDITERRQYEIALLERAEIERRQSQFFRVAPGCFYTFVMRPDGSIAMPFASAGMADLYGLLPEDAMKDVNVLLNLVQADDVESIFEAIEKSARDLTPYHVEFRILHQKKGMRWLEAKSLPQRHPDGSIRWHGFMHDITERKRTEDVLRLIAQRGWTADGESFLTGLTRYLGQMLAVDYVLIDKLADDSTVAETVGIYAKGEVLPNMQYSLDGTPCQNVMMDGDLCSYPTGVQQSFPEDTLLVEMQVESYVGIPLWGSTGKVIGLIAVMDGKPMLDTSMIASLLKLVATRVAAELERERSAQALAESWQFLNRVIDAIPDPIFVKDRAHRWLLLNRAFCNLIGHSSDELLGKSDYDFFPTQEADVFWAKDEAVFESGEESVNEENFTDSDGNTHIIVTKKTCFTDNKGEPVLVGGIKDITAIKNTERHLVETRNRLKSVIQMLPDLVWLKDTEGVYLACNHAFERFFGAVEADVVGKTDYDFVDAELAAFFRQKDMEALEAGHLRINEEWVTIAEDQRQTLLETRKIPVHGVDGEVVGILGIGRDITERKRLESALVEREREFRSLAENMPDNIARWDIEGRIIFSNPTHQRTLGKPAIDLIGKTHIEAFPDDRYRPVDTAIAQVVATGEPILFVRQLVPAENGEMRIHDIKLVPEFDDAGQVVSVLGIGRDMTDVSRMQDAIAAREQEFRSLAENLPDNIGRWDTEGRYRYVNAVYERTIARLAADVIGKTIGEAFPERRESPVAIAVARVIATGETVPCVRHLMPAENGEMRIHEVSLVPEWDADGKIVGVLGIGRDMTDTYRMQEAIAAREQEFRSLAESSPNSIIRYDRDGRIRYLNSGLARLLGVSTEVIGKFPSEIWSDGRFDEIQRAAAQAVETATEVSIEICDPSAEGEAHYHQIRIVPERDAAGRVIGTIAFGWDITDLKRYAQSLLERAKLEEQLSAIAASVPGFIYTIREDADGHTSFPYASTGIEELFGLHPDDVREDAAVFRARYHPEDLHRAMELIEKSKRDLSAYRAEIRIQHPYKGQRWVEIRSTPRRLEDGSTEWHGIMLDITERKAAERQLTLLNSSLDHVNDTFLLISEDASILYVNEEACHILGYSREQLQGLRIADIDPDYQLEIWPTHWHDLKTHGALNFESSHKTSDGRIYPVDITANYVEFEGKGYSLAICRDISERKRAEALLNERLERILELNGRLEENARSLEEQAVELEEKTVELEASQDQIKLTEAWYRGIVRSAPDGMVVVNARGHISLANEHLEKMFGYREGELLGQPMEILLPPEARNKHVSQRDGFFSSGAMGRSMTGTMGDFYAIRKDGSVFPVDVSLSRLPDVEGSVGIVCAAIRDITGQRHAQRLEAERQRVFEHMAQSGELSLVLEQVALYLDVAKPDLRSCIMLLDDHGRRLYGAAAPLFPEAATAIQGLEIAAGAGCCSVAARDSVRVVVEDVRSHPSWATFQEFAAEHDILASWSEPIMASSGHVLGVVTVYLRETGVPTDTDLELLRQASNLCAIAIERHRLETQMQHQASYDGLTGLPNRHLLNDRLHEEIAKAGRGGSNLALLFIDLDHFKEVNDTLGHRIGDLLLIETASRIRGALREADLVARLSGDEFVVILSQVEEISHLGRLAQCLVDAMAQPYHLEERIAYVSASIGIASYPLDADNAETLIGCADQAMYAAKGHGRNNFSFFTADMQQQVQARMLLINDLRDALGLGQLQVHYQPIVDIATGRIVKAEALLRWKHPHRGMVPPDQFIPVAEKNGLIHEIGDWVFREAVGSAKRWAAINGAGGQISVNVSPRQFIKGDIDTAWVDYLHSSGLPLAQIAIEITEGLLLDDRLEMMDTLERLREAGLQISLDDFGTGYSAMAYLKKFPIDYLKIDRSFVRDLENDPGDRAIAEAIVVMAHKLGLKTIAEGVETEAQRDLLAAVGCEYVQGYLYAKPMPEAQFLEFVEQYNMKESFDV